VVDGKIFIEHFLQVLADVAQAQVETLERLQLRGYARGESADCNVSDITEKMLDADFLCFFGFDK
jgi:hypothetical protein